MPKFLVELEDGKKFQVEADQQPSPEEVSQYLTVSKEAERPFLDITDTASALGRAATSLATTVPASLSQAWEGLENPWKRSESYMQRRQEMQSLQEEMQRADEEAATSGDLSSVSSTIRQAIPSLGFSGATLAPSIAAYGGTLALTKSPTAATGAAAATSGLMAYRMAGAQFLDDAKDRIDQFFLENFERPPTEQEQEEAYNELLPLARKFGAAEAGPEALGNLALGGAGKYIRRALGGKNGIMQLASDALGKVTGAKAALAGTGAALSEIGTEDVTDVEQDRIQRQFEEGVMRGESPENVAIPDRSFGDYMKSFEEVAPTTLALTGMMGAAGLGPTVIARGVRSLRKPEPEIQIAAEALNATTDTPFTDISGQAAADTIAQNAELAMRMPVQPVEAAEEIAPEVTPSLPEAGPPAVDQEAPAGTPVQAAPIPEVASMPMMVTRDMKQQLVDLGYSRSDINAMRPEEAAAIIQSGISKPAPIQPITTQENAVQEQIPDESVLRQERPEMELQGMGEQNVQPEEVAGEVAQEEVAPTRPAPGMSREDFNRGMAAAVKRATQKEGVLPPQQITPPGEPTTATEGMVTPGGVATERVADKVYLSVPFTSKDTAKSLGAKWDKEKKLWFIQRGENGFMPEVSPRWIPDEQSVLRDKKELSAAKLNAEAKYNRTVEVAETSISGKKAFALKFTDGEWLNPNIEKTEQSFQQEQPKGDNVWMLPVEETEEKIWQNVFSRENEKLSDMKKGRRNPRSPYFNIRDSELDKQQREINRLQNNKGSIGIEWGELIRYFDEALADKKPISADQEKLFVAKRLPREEFLTRLARAGYEKRGNVFYHKQSSAGGGAVGQTRINPPSAAGGTPQTTAAETQTSGVAVERDLTKPEELSSEESAALRVSKLKGAKHQGDGVIFVPEKLMTPERRKAIQRGGKSIEVKAWADVTGVPSDRGYAILDRRARRAFRENKPVSAAAVDTYGIKLPEGYVKQGDLYVFQPQTTAAETQTPESLRVDSGAAGVVQSEPVEGSIPTDEKESAKTAIESTEKSLEDKEKSGKAESIILDDVTKKLYGIRGGIPTKDAQTVLQQVINATSPIKGSSAQFARALLSKFPSLNGTLVVSFQQFKNAMASLLYNNGKHGFSQEESFSAVNDFLPPNMDAFYDPFFDAVVLLDGKEIGPSVVAHEIGHAIEDKLFKDAPEKTRSDIIDAFNKHIARFEKQPIVTDYLPLFEIWYGSDKARPYSPDMPIDLASTVDMEYLKSFKEWFANQVAKWATSYEKPLSLVDKFFSSVASKIKELFNVVKGYFSPETSVVDYIHSLATSDMRSDIFLPKKKKQVKKQSFFDKMVPDSMRGNAQQGVEVPTSEKAKAAGYAEKLNSVRKLLRIGSNSTKAQNEALNDLMAMPLADLQAAFEVVTGIPTKLANKRQLANNVLNEILAESRNEKLPEADETFRKAEIEAEEEIQRQNAQSIANLFDKLRTNPQRGQVTRADVNQAIGALQNSGEVPNAIFTWNGTTDDLLRQRAAMERQFPGAVAAASMPNVEGVFENGMAFVFSNRVVVTDLDRRKAAEEGISPSVAAVKRVVTHENMHKGLWLLSPKQQSDIMSFLRQMFPAAELDELAKSYRQYADWRTNPVHEMALLDERLQKYIEETKTIPTDGVWKQFWDYIKEIWRKLTGKPKGEPTLQSMKDVVRLIRSALKNAHKARPDRTIDGGRVLMSYIGASAIENFPEKRRQFMRDSLETAKAMAAAGKDSEEIRAVTGWFPGKYDGKMRFEIVDDKAAYREKIGAYTKVKNWLYGKLSEETMEGTMVGIPLRQILDFPELYDAYPQIKKIKVDLEERNGAAFIPESNTIALSLDDTPAKRLSYLLHELQHWIQTHEGFAKGGSPKGFGFISKQAFDEYQRTAGEIEARDVQARQKLTPEQRAATAPYSSENIAPEDAIVLFGNGPQMSVSGGRSFVPAVNIDGRVEIGASHYDAWIKHALRQIPNFKKDGLSDEERRQLADRWIVDHPEFMAYSLRKEGFVSDGEFLNRQDSLKKFKSLGGVQQMAPGEPDRDWLDASDVEGYRFSIAPSPSLPDLKVNIQRELDAENEEALKKLVPQSITILTLEDHVDLDDDGLPSKYYLMTVGGADEAVAMLRSGMPRDQFVWMESSDKSSDKQAVSELGEILFEGFLDKKAFKDVRVNRATVPTYGGEVSGAMFSISPVSYASEQDEASSIGQQTARYAASSPRTIETIVGVRQAYASMPKSNGAAVMLDDLFAEAAKLVPTLTRPKFDRVIQGMYDDNAALLNDAQNPSSVTILPGAMMSMAGGANDAEYLAAVEAGDMEKAQRMVDEAAKRAGYDGPYFHGSDEYRDIFDGGAFFTDSKSDASGYARLRSIYKSAQENDELMEIVGDVMSEEGMEDITDMSPDTLIDIAEANGFELNDANGFVFRGFLNTGNVLDISDMGASGSVRDAWDFLHEKGLIDEPWSEMDEEVKGEILDQYQGKAYYRILEGEGIFSKAFSQGYDTVKFADQDVTGRAEHDSWITKKANQFKSADPVTYDDSGNVIPLSQRFQPASPDIRFSIASNPEQQSAAAKFKSAITAAAKGLPDFREYEGRLVKAASGEAIDVEPHNVLWFDGFMKASEQLLSDLQKQGLSLQQIYDKVAMDTEFKRELGLFDEETGSGQAATVLSGLLLQRTLNAARKARTAEAKAQGDALHRKAAAYYSALATARGQNLLMYHLLQSDPRTRFAFMEDKVTREMLKKAEHGVNVQFGDGYAATQEAVNDAVDASAEAAKTEVADAVENAAEEDQDAIDLAEGEATLTGKLRELYERLKDLLRENGILARLDKEEQDIGAMMSISPERRSELAKLTKEERAKLRQKNEAKIEEILKAILGEESEAKTPEQKSTRKKREKMVKTAQKRAEKGQDIDIKPTDVSKIINQVRRDIKTPSGKPIQWREIFRQPGKTVEEYRQNIFNAVNSNEAFKDLDEAQKRRLSELFAEAWQAQRDKILASMIEQHTYSLERQQKKEAAKALRDARNQIIEAVNLGAFSNDELTRVLGEKFGFKTSFTEDEKQKLSDLAEKLQDENLNKAKRNKLAREFLSTLQSGTQIPIAELLSNWWVSAVLSGGNTVSAIALSFLNGTGIGIMGTHLSRALRELMKGNTANAIDAVTSLFKAYAKHISSFPTAANRAWQYLWSGDVSFLESAANDPFGRVNTLADIAKYQVVADQVAKDPNKVKAVMGRFMQFMGRLLTALDAFNVMVTKAGTVSLAIRQSGLTPEQIRDAELKNDLKFYKDKIVREDPHFGGKQPTSAKEKAYLSSLAEAEMYADLAEMGVKMENADYLASESAMTMNPTGFGGIVYNSIKALDTKVTSETEKHLDMAQVAWAKSKNAEDAIKLFTWSLVHFFAKQGLNVFGLRFARFAGNKFNQSLSFVPGLGLLRMIEADNKELAGRQEAFKDTIIRNQTLGWIIMFAGWAIIKAIEEEPDDEKRGWFINGGWNNLTPDQKKQKISRGEKQYTIGTGDYVFNYQNWPISQPLAALGALSDLVRFSQDKWKEKTTGGKAGSAVISGMQAALEIPALTQVNEIFANTMASKDPAEQTASRLSRVTAGWLGGFMPRILKDLDYIQDPTMRRYETLFQKAASHVPVYRRYVGSDYYDILGNKIEKNAIPGSRDFMKLEDRPEYRMLGALNARGIWLTPANAEYRMVGKGRFRRRLTQEEADRYSLETGKLYRQMVMNYGPRALQMPVERAKDYISAKADDMRDLALQRAVRN